MCAAKARRGARESTRQGIFARMKSAFEVEGVWDNLVKEVPAAKFTHPGDPLKFDCGYSFKLAHKKFKMFHAVAIESGTEPAKSLGYTWPVVRDGILMKERANATLTAIVNEGLDPEDERIAFSLSTFLRTGIKVATLAEMPQIAEQARRELGV